MPPDTTLQVIGGGLDAYWVHDGRVIGPDAPISTVPQGGTIEQRLRARGGVEGWEGSPHGSQSVRAASQSSFSTTTAAGLLETAVDTILEEPTDMRRQVAVRLLKKLAFGLVATSCLLSRWSNTMRKVEFFSYEQI